MFANSAKVLNSSYIYILQVCDAVGIRYQYNKDQGLKEEVYMVCALAFGMLFLKLFDKN